MIERQRELLPRAMKAFDEIDPELSIIQRRVQGGAVGVCNEHGTIYAISSDFGDQMTTQSMGLMVLLREHF